MWRKKKIDKLHKEYYVEDSYGRTDKVMVRKVNELIETVNELSKRIDILEGRRK